MKMNRLFKNILIGILSFILISAIAIFTVLWTFSNNIPDYKFLKNYKHTSFNKIDIFSPCATGGDLNSDFINFHKSNNVNCILGAANNQLANPDIEKKLFDLSIDYCPDYCVNAGGVIILALRSSLKEDMEYNDPQADVKLTAIKDQLKKILQLSKEKNQLSSISSNELAEKGFLL